MNNSEPFRAFPHFTVKSLCGGAVRSDALVFRRVDDQGWELAGKVKPVYLLISIKSPDCPPGTSQVCTNSREIFHNYVALSSMTLKKITFKNSIPKLQKICGNKMPTRCNRGFYCRSYCLLNMFRASLCPSSGAQTSILQTGRITLSSTPDQLLEKPQQKIPQAATTV